MVRQRASEESAATKAALAAGGAVATAVMLFSGIAQIFMSGALAQLWGMINGM